MVDNLGNVVPILEEYNPTMQLEGDEEIYTVYFAVDNSFIYAAEHMEIYSDSIVNITLNVNGRVVKYTGNIDIRK